MAPVGGDRACDDNEDGVVDFAGDADAKVGMEEDKDSGGKTKMDPTVGFAVDADAKKGVMEDNNSGGKTKVDPKKSKKGDGEKVAHAKKESQDNNGSNNEAKVKSVRSNRTRRPVKKFE